MQTKTHASHTRIRTRNDGTARPFGKKKCCLSDKLCAFVTRLSRAGLNMKLRMFGEETSLYRAGGTVTIRPCGMHMWPLTHGKICEYPYTVESATSVCRNGPRTGEILPTALRWNPSISPGHDLPSGRINEYRLSKSTYP
jgi:hypothetical protein